MALSKHKKGLLQFRKSMEEASKTLPANWVQIILKKKKLSREKYQKLYNLLVNCKAGRCYRSSRKHKTLIKEMINLANKYKNLGL